jgi:hypothetical protein
MPLVTSIFDIVMNKGKIVDKLDGCGGRHHPRRVTTHCLTTEKTKTRPNKFARLPITGTPGLILPAQVVSQYARQSGRTAIDNLF